MHGQKTLTLNIKLHRRHLNDHSFSLKMHLLCFLQLIHLVLNF